MQEALIETIKRETENLLRGLGKLLVPAMYRHPAGHARNAAYELTETWTDKAVRCVITNFSQEEIRFGGTRIMATDKKFLIPRRGLDFEMIPTGQIKTADNRVWEILEITTDPAGALYIAQCRLV